MPFPLALLLSFGSVFLAFLPLDTYIKSDERRIYYAGYELSRREASVTGKAFSKELKMESLLRLKTREEKKKEKETRRSSLSIVLFFVSLS